jgi:DNA-binding beta-propeller fold protein YncE
MASMSARPVLRGVAGAFGLLAAGLVVSGCLGGSSAAKPAAVHRAVRVKVLAAPKAILGAADPQPNGAMWVLSGSARVRTLTSIDLASGKTLNTVGVSSSASAVAESPTGVLALGLATARTGAVELLNATTGAVEGSVAVGAPVRSLAFGADGVTLYVLDGDPASTSVSVVNTSSDKVIQTFGEAHDAVDVVPDPSQSAVWTLDHSGGVEETSLASGKPDAAFPLEGAGLSVAAAPNGGLLYVLKGTAAASNIAVVSTVTDAIKKLLPAAGGSVALAISPDGRTLYDVVGTPSVGNIQEIRLGANGV